MSDHFLGHLIDLGGQIAIGMALVAIHAWASRWTHAWPLRLRKLIIGLLFGLSAVTSLLLPVELSKHVNISTALSSVALGGFFGGWVGGLTAAIVSSAARVFVEQRLTGALIRTMLGGILGASFAWWLARRRKEPVFVDLLMLGMLVVVMTIGSFLFAPPAVKQILLSEGSLSLAIALMAGTLLLGAQYMAEQRRQLLTDKLADSEARLRDVINNLPGTIYQMRLNKDGTLTYLYASEGVQASHGVTAEQMIADAHLVDSTFLAEEEEARWRYLRESMASMKPGQREFRSRLANGALLWLRTYSTPKKDAQGQVVWTGFTVNVTQEKKRDEELRRTLRDLDASERRLRSIIATVPGLVYQISQTADGTVNYRFVSDGVRAIFGVEPEAVLKDSSLILRTYFPEDEADRLRVLHESMDNLGMRERSFRIKREDGSIRWLNSRSNPHLEPDGDLVWDGVTLDVTKQKELEEELRRSEHMLALGGLVDGIAHNFNNLLQILAGNAELLLDDLKDQAEPRAIAQQMLDTVDRGARLVGELRRFSRRQPVPAENVDVNPLLSDLRDLASNFVGSSIRLSFTSSPKPQQVAVNPARLQTAVLSLILNARDAMPKGGEIKLETHNVRLDDGAAQRIDRLPGDYVEIVIADNGAGMTPEVLKRATEPFFTTKPANQSGMGLSTVHAFVTQAGGHLTLASELGKGTEVRLLLPAPSQLAAG